MPRAARTRNVNLGLGYMPAYPAVLTPRTPAPATDILVGVAKRLRREPDELKQLITSEALHKLLEKCWTIGVTEGTIDLLIMGELDALSIGQLLPAKG